MKLILPNSFRIILIMFIAFGAYAAKPNLDAPKGGNFTINIGGEPATLHPITSSDLYARNVQDYVCEGLLARNVETYAWQPALAEKWEISKDQKTFTFKLRKDAVFHDGKPVTAEDVKFSFDAIFEDAYQAFNLRPYFEGIEKIEIVDPYTVKAIAKDQYFKNFDVIAGLTVIPKHTYSDVEKSKKMNKTLVCSGPYKLESFEKSQSIVLKKFDKWWGNSDSTYKGSQNFETITMRFYNEDNIVIERAKKGDLDYIDLSAETYIKKTEGEPWGKSLFKHKIENITPKSYRYIGWNFKKELFKDKNVRIALAHLMNREEMNKKFHYDLSVLATSPIYVQSEYAPSIKPILFDPKKAQELLSKSGWKDTDKNGVLDKMVDGKKMEFRFTLTHANKNYEKYITIYKEDLKQAGIDMEIKFVEFNALVKILDEGNFDAISMGWGGGSIDPDPKQVWHSASAVVGGSNHIYYKNPAVDKLIDEGRYTLDRKKRIKIFQNAFKMIAEDAPYIFFFNDKYTLYATSNKIGMPAETFKYGLGIDYWWYQAP